MEIQKTNEAVPNISEMTDLEVIEACGRLKFSISQIVALLRYRLTVQDKNQLIINLKTPCTAEYEAYETGYVQADFELQRSLHAQAMIGGKGSKDALDGLNEEQRRQIINKALADKFGLEIDD